MKRRLVSIISAVIFVLAALMAISPTEASANTGPCGPYASGYAKNDLCGSNAVNKATIAATKVTTYYSAGQGGTKTRYGNYVAKGSTSYINANSGDTGAFGCDRDDQSVTISILGIAEFNEFHSSCS